MMCWHDLSFNQKKFWQSFIYIGIMAQVLIGILYSFRFSGNLSTFCYFLRNLLSLSFFIWSYFFLLDKAQKVSENFYKRIQKMSYTYYVLSLIITCFYYGTPYTVFSYLGYLATEVLVYESYKGPIYYSLIYLLNGSTL